MNAIPIEIAYCVNDKVVNEKTFARGFIKTNNVESTKDTPPANQSILFWFLIVKIEFLRERILKAWNTSAIESVINAMVVASTPLFSERT